MLWRIQIKWRWSAQARGRQRASRACGIRKNNDQGCGRAKQILKMRQYRQAGRPNSIYRGKGGWKSRAKKLASGMVHTGQEHPDWAEAAASSGRVWFWGELRETHAVGRGRRRRRRSRKEEERRRGKTIRGARAERWSACGECLGVAREKGRESECASEDCMGRREGELRT
jgi:hypothetical protein